MLTKTLRITNTRNAKTLSPSHMKQCIMSESRFDFLRELVKNVPDISMAEESAADNVNNSNESTNLSITMGGKNGHNDKSNNLVSQIASTVDNNTAANSLQTFHHQFSQQAIEPTAATTTTTSFYGVDNKASMPLSRNSNSMNFYTEIPSPNDSYCDNNQPQQQPPLKRVSTITVPPFKKLPKLTRLNSAPSTITSNQQQQPNFYSNNSVSSSSSSSNPSTPQFTISIPSNHHEIELNEPIIKLDYSHLSFQQPQTTYSPPSSQQYTSSTSTSTSLFNNNFNQTQQPTIKIDFSNLNTLNNKASTGPAATSAGMIANPWFQQQPQSGSGGGHQSTNGLDEDYDDI
jgi:Dr1-associated corepressor